jgi:hypothetical protein
MQQEIEREREIQFVSKNSESKQVQEMREKIEISVPFTSIKQNSFFIVIVV